MRCKKALEFNMQFVLQGIDEHYTSAEVGFQDLTSDAQ